MRNEDLTNFKASTLLNEKYMEDKSSFSNNFSIKEIFQNCANTITKLNNNIAIENNKNKNQTNWKFFNSVTSLISKLYLVIATFICILFIYYVYIYVKSSKSGISFDLLTSEYWEDSYYKTAMIKFLIFHLILILFLACLIRTLFTNPGYYHKEYVDMYSVTKSIKILYAFLTNKENTPFDFKIYFENNINDKIIDREMNSNRNTFTQKEIEELYELQAKIPNNILRKNSLSCSIISSMEQENNIFNEIQEYNFEEIDKNENKPNLNDDVIRFNMDYQNHLESNKEYEKYQHLPFYLINKDNRRVCGYCLIQKPDRARHCRYCRTCVRKLDHHCFYLYTCIGYGNYKFFILTLFYSIVLLLLMLITMIDGFQFYFSEYQGKYVLPIYCFFYFLILYLTIFVLKFFFFHLKLLSNNMTTIDHVENKRKQKNKYVENGFNLGRYKNISSVMGKISTWFLPISYDEEFNGYSHEINKEFLNRNLNDSSKK